MKTRDPIVPIMQALPVEILLQAVIETRPAIIAFIKSIGLYTIIAFKVSKFFIDSKAKKVIPADAEAIKEFLMMTWGILSYEYSTISSPDAALKKIQPNQRSKNPTTDND